jgi:hypothetical protein
MRDVIARWIRPDPRRPKRANPARQKLYRPQPASKKR